MSDLYSYLKPYYEAGLDAVLVQDMGAFTYIRKHFPDLPVHISTQMTVTGKYSARDLKALGAVRVVPARELSLKEIREIYDDTGLEVETFVHGALCYCYSGQCLFSSLIGGRSGNRGRCAQTCRLPFDAEQNGKYVNKKNEKIYLKLKGSLYPGSDPGYPGSGCLFLKDRGTHEESAVHGRSCKYLPEIRGPLLEGGAPDTMWRRQTGMPCWLFFRPGDSPRAITTPTTDGTWWS